MKLALIFVLSFFTACSGIKMLSGQDRQSLYTPAFIQKIDSIKAKYNRGDDTQALQDLNQIDEASLMPAEKALRRNLIGVVYFSKESFEQAIFNFNQGLTTSSQDKNLTAQISLNLASSYFKVGMNDRAYETIKVTDYASLSAQDLVSYHKLRYHLASEVGDKLDVMVSLFHALSDKKTIESLKSDPLYETLNNKFSEASDSDKKAVLREIESDDSFVYAYFSYLEAEKLHYKGEREKASELIAWLADKFKGNAEIENLVKDFQFRVENDTKMQPNLIGVVLPLSGDKKRYGERALTGLDAHLRSLKTEMPLKLVVKDSMGSAAVGARMVEQLIEEDSVAMIIGGLFSSEALREYEMARKRGVFFMSLSQVYLGKESKDHLLLEVPGSIESQINQLFSESTLNHFGKNGAIIYPKSKRGEAYVNEFWRKSKLLGANIKGIYSYDREKKNYSDPVKNLLGLKFPRVRQEEYDVWKEVYSLESRRSARRIQILKPEIQFDWVFVPSFPLEAIQIIPSFNFYDAFNVTLIGGPSWRSNRLNNGSYKYKGIHFIGEDYEDVSMEFSKKFYNDYGKKMKIIELRALDSANMAAQILSAKNYTMRDELDRDIRSLEEVRGLTGQWNLIDGVWIKKMSNLHFRKGTVSKVVENTVQETSENQQ